MLMAHFPYPWLFQGWGMSNKPMPGNCWASLSYQKSPGFRAKHRFWNSKNHLPPNASLWHFPCLFISNHITIYRTVHTIHRIIVFRWWKCTEWHTKGQSAVCVSVCFLISSMQKGMTTVTWRYNTLKRLTDAEPPSSAMNQGTKLSL